MEKLKLVYLILLHALAEGFAYRQMRRLQEFTKTPITAERYLAYLELLHSTRNTFNTTIVVKAIFIASLLYLCQ